MAAVLLTLHVQRRIGHQSSLWLSCHGLAVERLCWATRIRPGGVPCEDRLCRFCHLRGLGEVEDETHAVLSRSSYARLVDLRAAMWEDAEIEKSGKQEAARYLAKEGLLRGLMRRSEVVKRMERTFMKSWLCLRARRCMCQIRRRERTSESVLRI